MDDQEEHRRTPKMEEVDMEAGHFNSSLSVDFLKRSLDLHRKSGKARLSVNTTVSHENGFHHPIRHVSSMNNLEESEHESHHSTIRKTHSQHSFFDSSSLPRSASQKSILKSRDFESPSDQSLTSGSSLKSVSFYGKVQVKETVVEHKRPFLIANLFQIRYWNSSKLIHSIILLSILAILVFQSIVLGVQWNRQQCNRSGLSRLFLSTLCVGIVQMTLVLCKTIHRFAVDYFINRQVSPSSDRALLEGSNMLTSNDFHSDEERVYYLPLKLPGFTTSLSSRALKLLKIAAVTFWVFSRLFYLSTLSFVINIGDCAQTNKLLFYGNMTFFALNVLLSVFEITVVIVSFAT